MSAVDSDDGGDVEVDSSLGADVGPSLPAMTTVDSCWNDANSNIDAAIEMVRLLKFILFFGMNEFFTMIVCF